MESKPSVQLHINYGGKQNCLGSTNIKNNINLSGYKIKIGFSNTFYYTFKCCTWKRTRKKGFYIPIKNISLFWIASPENKSKPIHSRAQCYFSLSIVSLLATTLPRTCLEIRRQRNRSVLGQVRFNRFIIIVPLEI